METSAKTGLNVDKVFQDMAILIYEKIDNNQIDYSNDVKIK